MSFIAAVTVREAISCPPLALFPELRVTLSNVKRFGTHVTAFALM
jgi:hypothetical protein